MPDRPTSKSTSGRGKRSKASLEADEADEADASPVDGAAGHDDDAAHEGEPGDESALTGEIVQTASVLSDEELSDEELSAEERDEHASAGPMPARRRSTAGRGPEKVSTSLARRDPLAAYLQETKRHPLLSREEEKELAIKFVENADTDAARRLVESNLRLVVKLAYEYRRAHRNLLDLIQEGNIGLMQAVKKYDPYRGVKLSTYAAWWIRAYMLKYILNNWRLVKIGTTQAQRKLFFNLRKEHDRLEQQGFTPDAKLLAERLDVSEKDVVEMQKRLAAPDASLDAPIGGDDDGSRTRMDLLSADESNRPDVEVERSQFQTLLREKLDAFAVDLEGREDTIFHKRWLTDSPMTLQQIGDQYGVSRERARQVEKRLLGRLRKFLEIELGAAVDIGAMSGV